MVLGLLVFLGVIASLAWDRSQGPPAQPSQTSATYSAVFLQSGLVLYGKLEKFGSDYPVLYDVHYIRNEMDKETKSARMQLIRRGNEWHGPDRMTLNARHILFVEPVSPTSRIATLIHDEKAR